MINMELTSKQMRHIFMQLFRNEDMRAFAGGLTPDDKREVFMGIFNSPDDITVELLNELCQDLGAPVKAVPDIDTGWQYAMVTFNTYQEGTKVALASSRDGVDDLIRQCWWHIAQGEFEADAVQKMEGDPTKFVLSHDARSYRNTTTFQRIDLIPQTVYETLTDVDNSPFHF